MNGNFEKYDTCEEIYDELVSDLEKYDNWALFWGSEHMDLLVREYIRLMRELYMSDRDVSYRKMMDVAAYLFERKHPGSLWKCFYVNGSEKCRYTLAGEGYGESNATIRLLMHQNGCAYHEVSYDYRQF